MNENMKLRPDIFLDQIGYSPKSVKKAVIPFKCDEYSIFDENDTAVYTGKTSHFGYDEASGDDVYVADFSDFGNCGKYILRAENKKSAHFEIADDIYRSVCHDTVRAFYYLRCGCGLDRDHAGKFEHRPCHTENAVLWEDNSVSLDVTGGWHDAGDYGRYVTAGAVALAHLLYAYKMFPDGFRDIRTNIPDSTDNTPDLLTECRVELEWIMKMQRADGGVYHKATTKGHAPFIMPEEDTKQMFVLPVSSMATADTAAVCALASHIYSEFDKAFSDKLRECAMKAYEFLEKNPEYIFDSPKECTTGGYGERTDRDNRFWAAAELYSLTGEEKYHKALCKTATEQFGKASLGWGDVGGLGSLAYILCRHEKDEALCESFKNEFCRKADELAERSDKCGYGTALDSRQYGWGSNMVILMAAMTFIIANTLCGHKDMTDYAVRQMNYILGCNAVGISYITGSGEYSVCHPHYRPSESDGVDECHEGFVSGGANGYLSDPYCKHFIAEGTPPMKCFVDETMCYSLNEITIYWNSPAVFTAGYFHSRSIGNEKE